MGGVLFLHFVGLQTVIGTPSIRVAFFFVKVWN